MIRCNLNASIGCTWILSDYLYHDDDFESLSSPNLDTIKKLMAIDAAAYPSWYRPGDASHLPLEVDVHGTKMYGYLCHLAPYVKDCICTVGFDGSRSVMIILSDNCVQSLFYNQAETITDAERLDKATKKIRRRLSYSRDIREFINKVDEQGDEVLDVIRQLTGIIDANDDVITSTKFAELFE